MNHPPILQADDHRIMLERVRTLLQAMFDVVGAASNGREMVSEALPLNSDVIAADISMPELAGIEAAHELRERGSRVKLVFLTIHSNIEFANACLAEGPSGYVMKTHMKSDLFLRSARRSRASPFPRRRTSPALRVFPICRARGAAVQKVLNSPWCKSGFVGKNI